MDLRFGGSGSLESMGFGSGVESMGHPKRYGVMRGTRLRSSSTKQEAVCLVNTCWDT